MRRTALLLGGASAAIAIAALFLIFGVSPARNVSARGQDEARIGTGFTGVANFGAWRLICMSGPPSLNTLAADAPVAEAIKGRANNSCRVNHEMPAPGQEGGPGRKGAQTADKVIIAANFSLVGGTRTPAAMLRLPATADPGDIITLRLDGEADIKATVRDCATECLAASTLSNAEWERLSLARRLQVTFPLKNRQWVMLNLPVDGLAAAIRAMDRAEISALK